MSGWVKTAGPRLLWWGWLGLLLIGVLGSVAAMDTVERYSGARIVIRPWMQIYNTTQSAGHLLCLAALLLGCALFQTRGSARGLKAGACAALGAAVAAVCAMLAFPLVCGGGPFAPESPQVSALRLLVFLPSVLRGLGWALFLGALALASRRRLRQALCLGGIGLAGLDLALIGYKWHITPRAVLANLHPWQHDPAWLLPWIACGVLSIITLAILGEPWQ